MDSDNNSPWAAGSRYQTKEYETHKLSWSFARSSIVLENPAAQNAEYIDQTYKELLNHSPQAKPRLFHQLFLYTRKNNSNFSTITTIATQTRKSPTLKRAYVYDAVKSYRRLVIFPTGDSWNCSLHACWKAQAPSSDLPFLESWDPGLLSFEEQIPDPGDPKKTAMKRLKSTIETIKENWRGVISKTILKLFVFGRERCRSMRSEIGFLSLLRTEFRYSWTGKSSNELRYRLQIRLPETQAHSSVPASQRRG